MRVLVVEDDRALRVGLTDALVRQGFQVQSAADGDAAGDLLLGRHFDLVVLDLMLPGRSGLEVLREVREARLSVPVLILTARGEESDRVLGLELGADDYMVKPFGIRELVARVRALLRRARGGGAGSAGPGVPPLKVRLGAAEVDLGTFQVVRRGRAQRLSPREAALLACLLAREGQVVRREEILGEIWGTGAGAVGPRVVDTHVLNLRRKLGEDPAAPTHLRTVHGVGYCLVVEPPGPERHGEQEKPAGRGGRDGP